MTISPICFLPTSFSWHCLSRHLAFHQRHSLLDVIIQCKASESLPMSFSDPISDNEVNLMSQSDECMLEASSCSSFTDSYSSLFQKHIEGCPLMPTIAPCCMVAYPHSTDPTSGYSHVLWIPSMQTFPCLIFSWQPPGWPASAVDRLMWGCECPSCRVRGVVCRNTVWPIHSHNPMIHHRYETALS